ncbi:MAG TPA: hypothetical protein DCS33_02440 [Gammaproteobacteria bacterium]|nr:hypothetical protein [Gammaproteobacteria bacterium]
MVSTEPLSPVRQKTAPANLIPSTESSLTSIEASQLSPDVGIDVHDLSNSCQQILYFLVGNDAILKNISQSLNDGASRQHLLHGLIFIQPG